MTSRDFCFWLQGFFEISQRRPTLDEQQTELVRRHLALVFKHEIDPEMCPPEKQAELNAIHDGTSPKVKWPHYTADDGTVMRC